ncbi:hypothetical protein [Catenuloplanes japonicus]|uniref:hypothetical protein n=1 Tax=Catenuloplanes japonicus TaxID=33876 RepID=UPI0005247E05|nr:hypothetical protein [Catenuloplanes japonicus]
MARASGGGIGAIGAVVAALCLGIVVLGWPYLLGGWLADSFGAATGTRTLAAWGLELSYLVGLPLVVLLSRRRELGVDLVTRFVLPVVYGVFGAAILGVAVVLFTA